MRFLGLQSARAIITAPILLFWTHLLSARSLVKKYWTWTTSNCNADKSAQRLRRVHTFTTILLYTNFGIGGEPIYDQ
jgi:hypothetical protein